MKKKLLIIAGILAATLAIAHTDKFAFGEKGNPKQKFRIVHVKMQEGDGKMLFTPAKIEIKRGEQIKFTVENEGELDHEIIIDTLQGNLKHGEEMKKNPDMEHDDPNAIKLVSKKKGELLLKFTKIGTYDYSCLIPGHREAGMFGIITVK
jgi:uncharacterized cupredoxin-like copper-binding protein